MHYIIDGYNVIGQMRNIKLSMKNKEELFVDLVYTRILNTKDKATIYFDGNRKDEFFRTEYSKGAVTVIFTPCDEKADDAIINIVRHNNCNNNFNVTVVSSDNEIKYKCKKERVRVVSSLEFVYFLMNKGSFDTNNDAEYYGNEHDIKYWLDQFEK